MMVSETTTKKTPGRICVSIGRNDIAEALVAAQQVSQDADVIEIRLDYLHNPEIAPFTDSLRKPLLFTCRPAWEGGLYKGDEKERITLLSEAVHRRAAYVDLELLAPEESFSALSEIVNGCSTKLIISHHDFHATGSREQLLDIVTRMKNCGADIGKIITTAHTFQDVLRVLQLQSDAAELQLPLIAFCMGRVGVVSRVATLELGGYMTYCAANIEEAMAPGQIAVQVLRESLNSLFPG